MVAFVKPENSILSIRRNFYSTPKIPTLRFLLGVGERPMSPKIKVPYGRNSYKRTEQLNVYPSWFRDPAVYFIFRDDPDPHWRTPKLYRCRVTYPKSKLRPFRFCGIGDPHHREPSDRHMRANYFRVILHRSIIFLQQIARHSILLVTRSVCTRQENLFCLRRLSGNARLLKYAWWNRSSCNCGIEETDRAQSAEHGEQYTVEQAAISICHRISKKF